MSNSSKRRLLFSLILLLSLSIEIKCEYFELQIDRKQIPLQIDTSENIDLVTAIIQCPAQLSHPQQINRTSTPQICEHQDLLYTVQMLIGQGLDYNFEVVELGLDLSIPWTWVLSDRCLRCPDNTPIPPFKDMKKFDGCQISCAQEALKTNLTKSEYRITPQMRKVEKTYAEIVSFDSQVWGQYVYDSFSFLAYDPEQRKTFTEFLQQNFDPKDFSKFDQIIQLKNFKFLTADKLIGYAGFPAHGNIGLGLTLTESDNVQVQENTFFLQKLSLSIEEDRKTDQIFSIFIHDRTGPNFNDYLVTFGGYNKRYSLRQSEEIQFVDLVRDTGYYWTLPVAYLRVRRSDYVEPQAHATQWEASKYDSSIVQFALPYGIVSLSTSFIALPQIEFLRIQELIVSLLPAGSECTVVDSVTMALYCTALPSQDEIQKLQFEIFFTGSDVPVEIDAESITRQCTLSLSQTDRYDCVLNIQVSKDDQTVLGEPFLQKHYTIFDADQMRIGFLPAAQNSDWVDEISYIESFWWLSQFLLIVLAIGLTFICFMKNIQGCFQSIRNLFSYGVRTGVTEGMRLHDGASKEEDDGNYEDIKETMKQIALSKAKKEIFDEKDERERKLQFNLPPSQVSAAPQQEIFNNFGEFQQDTDIQPSNQDLIDTQNDSVPDININIPNIEELN